MTEKKKYDGVLYSGCCFAPVYDLAGDGIGGIDICPKCGEWAEIVGEDDEEESEEEKK